jgi:hypothetical protein
LGAHKRSATSEANPEVGSSSAAKRKDGRKKQNALGVKKVKGTSINPHDFLEMG